MGAGVVRALGWEFLLGNHAGSMSLPRGPIWGFSAFNSGAGVGLWEGLRAREAARPSPWVGLRLSTQPPGSASPFSMLLMFFRW